MREGTSCFRKKDIHDTHRCEYHAGVWQREKTRWRKNQRRRQGKGTIFWNNRGTSSLLYRLKKKKRQTKSQPVEKIVPAHICSASVTKRRRSSENFQEKNKGTQDESQAKSRLLQVARLVNQKRNGCHELFAFSHGESLESFFFFFKGDSLYATALGKFTISMRRRCCDIYRGVCYWGGTVRPEFEILLRDYATGYFF